MHLHSTFDIQRSTFAVQRTAFTLIELLVVVGIVALLLSITFPVIGKVRQAARETDTRAFISSLESACEAYRADFNAYPGPLAGSSIGALTQLPIYPVSGTTAINAGTVTTAGVVSGPRITQAENMVLGLLGGLIADRSVSGTVTYRFDPATVGQGPASLNAVRPGRSAARMQLASLSAGVFSDPEGVNISAKDTVIPEFVDRWPDALPILVLRARIGGRGIAATPTDTDNNIVVNVPFDGSDPTNGALNGQYNLVEITPYTQSDIGQHLKSTDYKPTQWTLGSAYHGLTTAKVDSALNKSHASFGYPYDAFAYLADPSSYDYQTKFTAFTAAERKAMKARKQDGIILISAGRDRVYGTSDDLTNFGSVLP